MKFISIKILGLLILLSLWGCDNTLVPFEDSTGNYSVYGVLDASKDVNYIRIKDLSLPIDDVPEAINATATLKSITTGEVETLKDTLIKFEGVNTHNFISRMNIEPESTYQLTITNLSGESFSVSASTPKVSDRNLIVTENPANPCNSNITTRFTPYDPDLPITVQLGLESRYELYWFDIIFPEARDFEDLFVINFSLNDMVGRYLLPGNSTSNNCHILSSTTIHFRYTHFGPEYLSGAASDSLNASGNVGSLIGVYSDSFSVDLPIIEGVIGD